MSAVQQAVISAAGLGTRLKEWGVANPKAMLVVAGKPLLQHQLERMQRYGIRHVVITVAHQAQKIINFLDSINLDLQISISHEGETPIGVLPGVMAARKYLKPGPFLLQSADTLFTDELSCELDSDKLALLYVYRSSKPDFFVRNNQICTSSSNDSLAVCYAGAGLYRPEFFDKPIAENFLQQIKLQAPNKVVAYVLNTKPRNINELTGL